jgi:hypothetical protein
MFYTEGVKSSAGIRGIDIGMYNGPLLAHVEMWNGGHEYTVTQYISSWGNRIEYIKFNIGSSSKNAITSLKGTPKGLYGTMYGNIMVTMKDFPPEGPWINSCLMQSNQGGTLSALCQIINDPACLVGKGCPYKATELNYKANCPKDALVYNNNGELKC